LLWAGWSVVRLCGACCVHTKGSNVLFQMQELESEQAGEPLCNTA